MKPTLLEIGDLLKQNNGATDKHFYGQVQSVDTDENGKVISYSVSLGGSSDIITCRKLAGAKVGDVVMVTLLANGTAVVTGTLGGDSDATDAQEAVTDIQEQIDSGDFDGEDATVLRIDSSRGTVFKNNQVATVLTVTIYTGEHRITGQRQLNEVYGPQAHLQWYWQRMDDLDYGIIVASDHKLSNDGFSLTLTPEEVDTKVTFRCELIV